MEVSLKRSSVGVGGGMGCMDDGGSFSMTSGANARGRGPKFGERLKVAPIHACRQRLSLSVSAISAFSPLKGAKGSRVGH